LASRLREYGVPVFECGVPDYQSPVGATIKRFLNTSWSSLDTESERSHRRAFEALQFADKSLVANKIATAQNEGQVVVCSRWAESAGIYAEASGLSEEWVDLLTNRLPVPDLRLMLDITEDTYKSRLGATPDKYEANFDMQHRVRSLFRGWSGGQTEAVRYPQGQSIGIDGNRSEAEVAESIWKLVVSTLIKQAAKPNLMTGTSFLYQTKKD
jgi:thymidylate kinase